MSINLGNIGSTRKLYISNSGISCKQDLHAVREFSKEALKNLGVLGSNAQVENIDRLFTNFGGNVRDKLVDLANIINMTTIVTHDHIEGSKYNSMRPNMPTRKELEYKLESIGVNGEYIQHIINICIHEGRMEKHGWFGLVDSFHTGTAQELYNLIKERINQLDENLNDKSVRPKEIISHLDIKKYYDNSPLEEREKNCVEELEEQLTRSIYDLFGEVEDSEFANFASDSGRITNAGKLLRIAKNAQRTTPEQLAQFYQQIFIDPYVKEFELADNEVVNYSAHGLREFVELLEFESLDNLNQFILILDLSQEYLLDILIDSYQVSIQNEIRACYNNRSEGLYLANCGLQAIPNKNILLLLSPHLLRLDLSYNQIREFPENTFNSLNCLQKLVLSSSYVNIRSYTGMLSPVLLNIYNNDELRKKNYIKCYSKSDVFGYYKVELVIKRNGLIGEFIPKFTGIK